MGRLWSLGGKLCIFLGNFITYLCACLFHLFDGCFVEIRILEIADGLIGNILSFFQNAVGFLVGLTQNILPAGIQTFLLGLKLSLKSLNLGFVLVDFQLFLLDGLAAVLQIGQNIIEVCVLVAESGSGVLDNIFRKSQLRADGKGITLSGNTDEQPVGGT